MSQPSWKIVVANLGTQEVVLQADLCADNWLAALRAGRDQLGDPGAVPAGASVVVAETGVVTILDAANRRRYVLTPAPVGVAPESRRPPARPSRAPEQVDEPESPAVLAARAAAARENAAPPLAEPPPAEPTPQPVEPSSPRQQQTLAYSAQRADALRREYESSRARSSVPPSERGNLRAVPAGDAASSMPPPPKLDQRLLNLRPSRPPSGQQAVLVPAFARDMDPTPKSPITYRERAFLIAPASDVGNLESLLQAELLKIRAELSSAPRGQLIHLAAFDKPFRGAPNEPPIATLEWSDWRGNAVFVSHAEAAAPQRASEASALAGDIPAPGSHVAPIPRAPSVPPSASFTPPSSAANGPAAAPTKPTTGKLAWEKLRKATAHNADKSESARPPAEASANEVPPSVPPSMPPDEPAREASAPAAAMPPPAALPWLNAPPPSQIPASAGAVELPAAFHTDAHKAARDDTGEVDNRLAQAFEALTDLYFLGTPISGIEFATQLISRLVPCEAISVCLYDINTDEYRFVAVGGPGADERRASAIPSSVGLFGAAKWSVEDAMVVAHVESDARYQPAFDGRGDLEMLNLCYVPLRKNGQLLGMVQLINRAGDLGFTAADIAVLHYIANQLSDFISTRRSMVS